MDRLNFKCGIIFSFILFIILVSEHTKVASACDLDQAHNGCRIDNGKCVCSYGCKSEFRYATREECNNALQGRANDICSRNPCLNHGTCIQISQQPGYKCRCEGTGFYGGRCQRLCPSPDDYAANNDRVFPHECVLI